MTKHTPEFLAKNNLKILFPKLAEEWDYEKNQKEGLGVPEDYSKGKNLVVHWICPKNSKHRYSTKICNRTRKYPINCPECAGKIPKTIPDVMPELLSIWDYEKNIDLDPSKLTPGSQKRAFFRCECGWRYGPLRIGDIRTRLLKDKEPCPVCNKSIPSENYNLEVCHPEIAKEWDEKKNGIKANQVLPSLNEVFWWNCPDKPHNYPLSLNARTNKTSPQNCPICSGRRVTKENNLETLEPDLAKEWSYKKNKDKKPTQFTSGSNQKVWWICPRGHDDYPATIYCRSKRNTGCPKCSNQTSKAELRILSELALIFKNILHREKIDGNELDIFIPEYSLGIEYDGWYYHHRKDVVDRELKKRSYFSKANINVIYIREYPLESLSVDDVVLPKSNKLDKNILNNIVVKAVKLAGINQPDDYLSKKDFCNEKRYRELISCLPGPVGKSLEDLFPEIAIEWDYELNKPLKPSQVSYGTNYKAHWICPKGHLYQKPVKDRTSKQRQGCKVCSQNRRRRSKTDSKD